MFGFTVMLFDLLKRWSTKLIENWDYFDWLIYIIFLSYVRLFNFRCKSIVYNIQSSYTKISKIAFSQDYEAEAINQRKIYSVLFCCNTYWNFFSHRKLICCKYLRFDQKPDLQQVLEAPRSSWQLASSEGWRLTPQLIGECTWRFFLWFSYFSPLLATSPSVWLLFGAMGCPWCPAWLPAPAATTTTTTTITTTMDDEEDRHASSKI